MGKQTTMEEQVVWQSTSCPDGLAAKNVVVGPVPAVVYSLRWDGNLNPDACSSTGTVGRPGVYWAEGRPHRWGAEQGALPGHHPEAGQDPVEPSQHDAGQHAVRPVSHQT